jgi:transketolase
MNLKEIVVLGEKDTRSGFGDAMTVLADTHPNVIALCADLTDSLKLGEFKKKAPNRFIQAGIAEANMIGVSAGLAIAGKIPFATSFANFVTGRVYDQIRQSVAYSDKNVKICASHAGLTLGEDGATHQILEDIGLMQMLPNMTVINTCDYNQTYAATLAIADYEGPVYLRFGRPKVPIFIPEGQKFEIGKALKICDGSDITIIATGHLVWESIVAAKKLKEEGISVEIINIHTIKPLDEAAILESVSKTKKVVVAEEHQRLGGLASTVALILAEKMPTPMAVVAVQDSFGESATPAELMKKYGLDSEAVYEKCKLLVSSFK